jgi:hypothetical protein
MVSTCYVKEMAIFDPGRTKILEPVRAKYCTIHNFNELTNGAKVDQGRFRGSVSACGLSCRFATFSLFSRTHAQLCQAVDPIGLHIPIDAVWPKDIPFGSLTNMTASVGNILSQNPHFWSEMGFLQLKRRLVYLSKDPLYHNAL